MNLLKTFPEIEIFFSNNKFTQEELAIFVTEIDKRYQDKQLRKSISTLIKLKLIQYETFPEENNAKINIVTVSKKSNYKTKIVEKTHSLSNDLKFRTVESISTLLEWNITQTLRLLEQKGIIKSEQGFLNDLEFKLVKEMFDARLLGLERIHKSNQVIQRINNKSKNKSINNKNNNDVYQKIASIGLGKVIYIRKQ